MNAKVKRLTQLERRTISERKLMEAGINMIAERGLDNISMADIGVAAGYSRGLPTQYFGTLKEFQRVLVHFIVSEYREYLLKRGESPGLKSLIDIIRKDCDPSQRDTMLMSIIYIIMSDTARDPVFDDDLVGLRDATLDLIELHINAGIRKKEIRKSVDPKRLAMIVMISVRGLIEEWLLDRSFELEPAGIALIDLFIRGLTPGSAPKANSGTA